MNKRTVPQAVFETRQALAAAKAGHQQACEELARTPVDQLGEGNPNHPHYNIIGKVFGKRVR